MSNFQFAIDNAKTITIAQQDIHSGTIARTGNVTTGTVVGSRPYQIEVEVADFFDAGNDEVKSFCAFIDNNAYVTQESIDIGKTNTGLSYITGYQGESNSTVLTGLSLSSYGRPGSANTSNQSPPVQLTPSYKYLTLRTHQNDLPQSSEVLFAVGDYIQLANANEKPYQVESEVKGSDFYGGIGDKYVDVKLNRFYTKYDDSVPANTTVNVGSNVEFKVTLINRPSYTILPGGPNNLIQFNEPFQFLEVS